MKINYFIKAVVVGLSVSTLVSTSYAASRSSYSSSSNEARIHHHRVVNHILQALRAPILLDQVVA